MTENVVAINPDSLYRTHFDSAQELAHLLATKIKEDKQAISLFTDFRWYAEQIVNPHIGYVTNVSIGYSGDFTEKELIEALENEGIAAINLLGQSSVYVLWTSEREVRLVGTSCYIVS